MGEAKRPPPSTNRNSGAEYQRLTNKTMSAKHSITTADYLEWDTAMNLIKKLYRDGDYKMSLMIGCGCMFGLRISDLLQLRWAQLLNDSKFIITEIKTGKTREIRINKEFQEHIKDCYEALQVKSLEEHCFLNRFGSVVSTQFVNRALKEIKVKYRLGIEHFSTHSFRKTFGRKVVQNAGEQSEMALILLGEIFHHSSVMITRRYLGLRKAELDGVFDKLSF